MILKPWRKESVGTTQFLEGGKVKSRLRSVRVGAVGEYLRYCRYYVAEYVCHTWIDRTHKLDEPFGVATELSSIPDVMMQGGDINMRR